MRHTRRRAVICLIGLLITAIPLKILTDQLYSESSALESWEEVDESEEFLELQDVVGHHLLQDEASFQPPEAAPPRPASVIPREAEEPILKQPASEDPTVMTRGADQEPAHSPKPASVVMTGEEPASVMARGGEEPAYSPKPGKMTGEEPAPVVMTGEERARNVWERCQHSFNPRRCPYGLKRLPKRILLMLNEKATFCSLGKAGTSNFKTLVLQLNGAVTREEAAEMIYPHSRNLWLPNGTLAMMNNYNKDTADMIVRDWYRITFVRDPLSRILSAYRDKFTGTQKMYEFRVYRQAYARAICEALQVHFLDSRPDGDRVPDEVYAYIEGELKKHCHPTEELEKDIFISLGLFWAFLIFVPDDADEALGSIKINAHFKSMTGLCQHCSPLFKYDFIGSVETLSDDMDFLKKKFNITLDFPNINSTQEGAISTEEVRKMWDNLPAVLREYALVHLEDDAHVFGYSGYETSLDKELYPWHNEKQCIAKSKDSCTCTGM